MSSKPASEPQWLLSFGDLLSLILSFFVLSYSMSLPIKVQTNEFEKTANNDFALKTENTPEEVKLANTDQDLSTNYLYQVMEKKIKSDPDLITKLTLHKNGGNFIATIRIKDYLPLTKKISELLNSIPNDIWLYSENIETSKKAYEELQKKGFDKKITFMQTNSINSQIDFVIQP